MSFKDQSFYLISNSSTDLYQDNSLSNFRNNLPINFETQSHEQAEVALTFLGLTTNFQNIPIPPKGLPSLYISNCYKKTTAVCEGGINCNIPVEFKFQDNAKLAEEIVACEWGGFYFENKSYDFEELQSFFENVQISCNEHGIPIKIYFTDNFQVCIESISNISFWVLIHKSMIDAFNFKNSIIFEEPIYDVSDKDNKVYVVKIANEKTVYLRKTYIKGEEYFTYLVRQRLTREGPESEDIFIHSAPSKILHKKLPNIIKVVCDNISPQIFNKSFSKDLVVFSPDFSNKDEYLTIEFANKQYVPISNSYISDFLIKLVDENNMPLQLSPGPSTLIKMDIRHRSLDKNSFNVRLTSAKSEEYQDNDNAIFKVKLPAPIEVTRDWRVALTSISHPNVFSTFIADEDTRSFFVREITGDKKIMKLKIPDNRKIYTVEEILYHLNLNLILANVGTVSSVNGKCEFRFNNEVIIVASNYLLKILGYHGIINERRKVSKMIVNTGNEINHITDDTHQIIKSDDNKYVLTFKSGFDLNYLKPTYIMVYSNIVSRSILGGTMSNIIKVVPLKSSNKDYYVISDFKHKEYYELQNSIVESIRIELRSHDGVPINFASNQDTILNLEFSNYTEKIM